MTATLAHICRHPIKAIGFEECARAALESGRTLPFDRLWAVVHEAAGPDAAGGGWSAKRNYLRGAVAPDLMAVAARLDDAGGLTLSHPRRDPAHVMPGDPADAARLIEWLRPLWPANRPGPARVVRAAGPALTDVQEPWVSVLNLASNRALGQRLGRALSIHRWRGNLWIDGLAPWEEFDLIDREIAIGPARLRIEQRITRCQATTANPETGRVDADTLGALDEGQGHRDFGVYAVVVAGGEVATGDRVAL